jgi:hypothetical protein
MFELVRFNLCTTWIFFLFIIRHAPLHSAILHAVLKFLSHGFHISVCAALNIKSDNLFVVRHQSLLRHGLVFPASKALYLNILSKNILRNIILSVLVPRKRPQLHLTGFLIYNVHNT